MVRAQPTPLPLIARETWDIRLYRWFGNLLGLLVLAYLFLDRGIAHFHLPKTPFFIGELTLAFGLLAVLVGTQWLRRSLSSDLLMATLIAFMVWGLLRTLPNLHIFGIQVTVRDAALWYYAAFAIAFLAATTAVPGLLRKMVDAFKVAVVVLTVWLPIALLLERSGVLGPKFRYSSVPLLSHKPGNICCAAVICLVFLLLVSPFSSPRPRAGRIMRLGNYGPSFRNLLVVINVFTLLLGATQTRGGAIAELVAVLLMFILMDRGRRSRIAMSFVAGLAIVLGFGLVTGASYHTDKRTISVSQLFENAQSVDGGTDQNPQLSGSVNFRFDLWSTILGKQISTSHLVIGFGMGPNLARTGGLNPRPNQPATLQLRSAHNSLLDIFARLGIIGATLFAVFFIGWFRRMKRGHRHSSDDETRGMIAVCMCGTLAILINSFFDPTIEGAQVAVVMYLLVGIGVALVRQPLTAPPTTGALTSEIQRTLRPPAVRRSLPQSPRVV
jgi:O-antigen ligase